MTLSLLRDQMSFSWSACEDDSPATTNCGKRPKTSHYNDIVQVQVSPVRTTPVTTTISSWDIDGGLAADFDGSLSGLGSELGSTPYNMSEALLALPVFKQENLDNGYQYILGAATSPAVKVNEETLTYLNQGQSYEIKLKKLGEITDYEGQYLRSTVRVCFHERRLQYMEKEQLDSWMLTRPGERILDIDIPLSYGLIDVKLDGMNAIDFVWDPTKETGIYVKVNCISTEFTPKKHGGEKGVPFRLQVETYTSREEDSKLAHCASCQVKVFKPKGADRKHKTDREKMEKRTGSEKEKYQPSYECTVLTEVPVDSIVQKPVRNGHSSLGSFGSLAQALKDPSITGSNKGSNFEVWQWQQPGQGGSGSPTGSGFQEGQANVCAPTKKGLYTSPTINKTEPSSPLSSIDSGPTQSTSTTTKDNTSTTPSITVPDSLSPEASAKEVTSWLHHNRFNHYINIFQNFSGADLLRLTRDDLIQICGLADGIRLNNALQSRPHWMKEGYNLPTATSAKWGVRPRLTLYMCQEPGTVYHAVYLESLTVEELISRISDLFSLKRYTISESYVQGPSAIHILLTDEVVRNFQDLSRFWIEILDQKTNKESIECLRLLLKTIE